METKKKILLAIILFYIIYIIFPLFSDLVEVPVFLPSMLTFFGIYYLYPRAFHCDIMRWFLVYAIVLIIYLVMGRALTIGIGLMPGPQKIFIEFAFILPALSIYMVLKFLNDKKLFGIVSISTISLLMISFLYILPLLQISSNILRVDDSQQIVHIPGLPSYGLMHAYVLLIPGLCYGCRRLTGRKKLFMLLILLVYVFLITKTNVTTSIFLTAFILVFSLLYSERNVNRTFFAFLLIAIAVASFYEMGGFSMLIDWIYPYFEGTVVEPKLKDFQYSLSVGHLEGGTIEGRQNYHQVSWDSFWNNPILGGGNAGGHSTFIDRLGGMGLVGFVPFILIFLSFAKDVVELYRTRTAKIYAVVTIFVSFVYLYNKGNWGNESWLFLMALSPSVIYTFERYNHRIKIYGE